MARARRRPSARGREDERLGEDQHGHRAKSCGHGVSERPDASREPGSDEQYRGTGERHRDGAGAGEEGEAGSGERGPGARLEEGGRARRVTQAVDQAGEGGQRRGRRRVRPPGRLGNQPSPASAGYSAGSACSEQRDSSQDERAGQQHDDSPERRGAPDRSMSSSLAAGSGSGQWYERRRLPYSRA